MVGLLYQCIFSLHNFISFSEASVIITIGVFYTILGQVGLVEFFHTSGRGNTNSGNTSVFKVSRPRDTDETSEDASRLAYNSVIVSP